MTAGRRHRKGRRGTRRMRGGAYGPGAAIAPGAIEWVKTDTSTPVSSATGQQVADPFGTNPTTNAVARGGRRHRATKKGGKRRLTKKGGRRHKRRTMRGGGWTPTNVNSAPAGTGFVGAIPNFPNGGGTYGAYAGYATNVPGGNPHPMGADGITRV